MAKSLIIIFWLKHVVRYYMTHVSHYLIFVKIKFYVYVDNV